jgi:hypothetical protein
MLEAYKIGVGLHLTDLITPKLVELSKQMMKVELQVSSLDRQFKQIGKANGGIKQATNYAAALDRAIGKTEAHAKVLVRTFGKLSAFDAKSVAGVNLMLGELDKADGAAGRLSGHLARITAFNPEMRELGRATKTLSDALRTSSSNAALLAHQIRAIHQMGAIPSSHIPNVPLSPGGGGGGGRRGGHNGGGLHGGRLHIGPGGVGAGSVGFGLGADSLVPLAAGYGAYALGSASVKEAAEYQRQKSLFKMLGMTPEQNAEAFRFIEQTDMSGASMISKLRYFTEAQGVFRESGMAGDEALKASKMMAPILSRLHYASTITGKPLDEHQELAMLRFIETSGGLADPKRAAELADLGYRTTVSSGGNVNWESMRQARANGGISVKNMSDEAFFAWAEPLIGELTGGKFATGMMTSYNRMNGINRLTKAQLNEYQKLGLWDMSKVVLNKAGGVDHYNGNPLKWSEDRATNPFLWHMQHVMPQYDALKLTQAERDRENNILYGNTGARVFSLFEQQMHTILQGVNTYKITPGADKGSKEADATYIGNMEKFDASWSDFKVTFGASALPAVTDMLKQGTSLLKMLGNADTNMRDEQAYVNGGGGFWGRVKRAFDWEPGMGGVAPKRDAAVAGGGSGATHVTVQATMDGTPIHTKVVNTIVRKTNTGLGSGFYDLNASAPTQFVTGH